jgi:hypothetical protein
MRTSRLYISVMSVAIGAATIAVAACVSLFPEQHLARTEKAKAARAEWPITGPEINRAAFGRAAEGQLWEVPADRAVVWNPGVPGGIPHRTNVCSNVPAGASVATIQAALEACPAEGVVQLAAGQFNVNGDSIWVPTSRTLRGAGPGLTRLVSPSGASLQVAPVTIGHLWPGYTGARNLTVTAARGSNTVTLANASGLAVGEVVLIDQLTDSNLSTWGSGCTSAGAECRGWFTRQNRPIGEMVRITAITGNIVTFDPPLSLDYKTTSTAQLVRFADNNGNAVPLVSRAGVEDLTITNPNSQNEKGGVLLVWAAESWVRNVEVLNTKGDNVSLDGCFRCEVRTVKAQIPLSVPVAPGGARYGLSFAHYSSQSLVEDSIFDGHNKVMVMRAAGPGNVIAYSVLDNGRITGDDWTETGLNPGHMATPHHTLFEGNWSFNGGGENTWGNGIYSTYFRNHLTGKRTSVAYQNFTRGASPMQGHWWDSWAGNVLGLPGQPPFIYQQTSGWDGHSIWKIGVNPETWTAGDPKVISTLLREGNFDYERLQVDGTGADLPASLYLTGAPAFWPAGVAWPPVDPYGPVKVGCIPARARLDGTTCGTAEPTPTPSVSPTATSTPSPDPTVTPAPTSTPTAQPTVTPTPQPPTPTPTPQPTPTPPPPPCPLGEQKAIAWSTNDATNAAQIAAQKALGFRLSFGIQGKAIYERVACP